MTAVEKAQKLVKTFGKELALKAVERNILMFTELVNRMDDFSNESRQVIWQLIEDEQELKHELNKSE